VLNNIDVLLKNVSIVHIYIDIVVKNMGFVLKNISIFLKDAGIVVNNISLIKSYIGRLVNYSDSDFKILHFLQKSYIPLMQPALPNYKIINFICLASPSLKSHFFRS
jgi:hypothetical protein